MYDFLYVLGLSRIKIRVAAIPEVNAAAEKADRVMSGITTILVRYAYTDVPLDITFAVPITSLDRVLALKDATLEAHANSLGDWSHHVAQVTRGMNDPIAIRETQIDWLMRFGELQKATRILDILEVELMQR